jgi:hypothetical protein
VGSTIGGMMCDLGHTTAEQDSRKDTLSRMQSGRAENTEKWTSVGPRTKLKTIPQRLKPS